MHEAKTKNIKKEKLT